MLEIENVIKGLEHCKIGDCAGCPYDQIREESLHGKHDKWELVCNEQLTEDILSLLKEQEERIKNRDESLEKAREEIKWLRGMLKEQEAMSWINVKDKLPNENGSYLVVYKAFRYALMDVKRFAKDLCLVDEYDFPNEHRPGWYECDDEYGYIERSDITHWMPLPNLPEEGR